MQSKIFDLEGGLKPLTARLGGKVLLKKTIVDKFFPSSTSYKTYIEPFVGGGSVYFYKDKDGHKEVVNDIDPLIYKIFNGFKKYSSEQISKDVVGNYDKSDFKNLLELTPSSEYDKFLQQFLINRLSFFARSKTFGKPRINAQFNGYDERLREATILNDDWKAVVRKYNTKDAFFYLDPPAVAGDSAFRYPAVDVGELKTACDSIVGKFCLTYPDKDDIQKVFSKYHCTKLGTKYVGDRTTGGQTKPQSEWIITNYVQGSGKTTGKYVKPFTDYLKEKKIEPENYLKVVKHVASKKGYDPALLSFNTDGVHKLTYDSPAGIRHFGSAKLNDYIIYVMKEGIDFPVGNASKKQAAYHKRFTDDKVHEKFSPWELSKNLLW